MRYYVHSAGTTFGPADLPTLRQWYLEGRITAATLISDEQGRQHAASSLIPDLQSQAGPAPFGTQTGMPGQPLPPQAGMYSPSNPYWSNPYGSHQQVSGWASAAVIASFACSGLGILCMCTPIGGILGIILGWIGMAQGSPIGKTAVWVGAASIAICLIVMFVGRGILSSMPSPGIIGVSA